MAAMDEGPIGVTTRGMLKRSAAAAGLALRPASAANVVAAQPPAKRPTPRPRQLQLQPEPVVVRPQNGPPSRECDLLTEDYVDNINEYQFAREGQYLLPEGFLVGKTVTVEMRAVLVDWIVEIQHNLNLLSDTLPLAIYMVDRYLQRGAEVDNTKRALTLLGVAATWAAAKYEEVTWPEIPELLPLLQGVEKKELLSMERAVVAATGFDLGVPHPKHFLFHFWVKEGEMDPDVYHLAKYLVEMCLVDVSFTSIKASLIGAGSLWLAGAIKGANLDLQESFASVADGAFAANARKTGQKMASLVLQVRREKRLQTVTEKYSMTKMHRVSLLTEKEESLLEKAAR